MQFTIYNVFTLSTIFTADTTSFANCVRLAIGGGTSLREANFRDADLRFVNFDDVDLCNASFRRANLADASFRRANLAGAEFESAILHDTDFLDANLEGVAESLGITVDPLLPQRILDSIKDDPCSWDQEHWHSRCGTKHCIAGFATYLSGPLGMYLDKAFGTPTAARLLLWREGGMMPAFDAIASEEATLGVLRQMAEKASKEAYKQDE